MKNSKKLFVLFKNLRLTGGLFSNKNLIKNYYFAYIDFLNNKKEKKLYAKISLNINKHNS